MNKSEKVICIIIHFGAMSSTVTALCSAIDSGVSHVIIVDNGDSFDISKTDYDYPRSQVTILRPKANLGFANGVNYALESLGNLRHFSHVLLLNNDAVLINNSLECMLESCSQKSAVTGYALNSSGLRIPLASFLSKTKLFSHEIKKNSQLMARDKAWLSGACLLISVDNYNIPRFDPNFFMYWEDAEYSWRLKNYFKYKLILIDYDVCIHTPGTSSLNKVALRYSWHLAGHIRYLKLTEGKNTMTSSIIAIKYLIISIKLKSLFLFNEALLRILNN